MPVRIPIKAAKDFAKANGCTQVIILAWDGTTTHVVTYGKTLTDCAQAAEGGNKIKKFIGFPDELCHSVPRRLKKKTPA